MATKKTAPKKSVKLAKADQTIVDAVAVYKADGVRSPELFQELDAWSDREQMRELGDRLAALVGRGVLVVEGVPPKIKLAEFEGTSVEPAPVVPDLGSEEEDDEL